MELKFTRQQERVLNEMNSEDRELVVNTLVSQIESGCFSLKDIKEQDLIDVLDDAKRYEKMKKQK